LHPTYLHQLTTKKNTVSSQLAGLRRLEYNFDSKKYFGTTSWSSSKRQKPKLAFIIKHTSDSYSKNRYCKKWIANTIQTASNWTAIPSDKRIKLPFWSNKTEKIRPIRESYLQIKALISCQWIIVHLEVHSMRRSIPNDELDELVWLEQKRWNQLPWTESDVQEQTLKWCTIAFAVDQYADVSSVTDHADYNDLILLILLWIDYSSRWTLWCIRNGPHTWSN
jgi:hypothetical protein